MPVHEVAGGVAHSTHAGVRHQHWSFGTSSAERVRSTVRSERRERERERERKSACVHVFAYIYIYVCVCV